MEYNIINEIDFDLKKEYTDYFDQIIKRSLDLLKIDKQYVFSIILVNQNKIHEINRDYRNIDRPTDVISFALMDGEDTITSEEEENELGDIFINVDAIGEQAQEYGHSFEREFCFLFTHGMLHLLGYDHIIEKDEKEMFALQDEILNEIITR